MLHFAGKKQKNTKFNNFFRSFHLLGVFVVKTEENFYYYCTFTVLPDLLEGSRWGEGFCRAIGRGGARAFAAQETVAVAFVTALVLWIKCFALAFGSPASPQKPFLFYIYVKKKRNTSFFLSTFTIFRFSSTFAIKLSTSLTTIEGFLLLADSKKNTQKKVFAYYIGRKWQRS